MRKITERLETPGILMFVCLGSFHAARVSADGIAGLTSPAWSPLAFLVLLAINSFFVGDVMSRRWK